MARKLQRIMFLKEANSNGRVDSSKLDPTQTARASLATAYQFFSLVTRFSAQRIEARMYLIYNHYKEM